MPYVSDDPWADFDAAPLADDPWDSFDLPEVGASAQWAGRPVSAAAVRRVADQNKVSPETIMRLGTIPGRIESALAKTEAGAIALRATEGIAGIGEQVGAAVSRAVGRGDISARIHDGRRKRQEWLQFIEKGGAIEEAMNALGAGERGARVFNQTIQSLGEIGTIGALTGPTGIYSYTVGSAWEQGLDDGERDGLYGGELVGHAGRQAAIEGGLTFLMGRAGAKLGIQSLEESFSPAARNAARKFLNSPSVREKLKTAAKELGGWTSEGVEEMLISGGQQLNEISSDMRDGFDWSEMFEAGASGVLGRGAVGAIKGLQSELQKFEKQLPDIVSGTRAAEIDIERGVNPFEVRDLDGAEFDKQTGREGTSQQYRDSYRDALDFYIEEMRRDGQTGALAKMEEDVRRLREEERQRAERIKANKQRSKGRAGESQVRTEPVQEAPLQTADERAIFSLAEFEARVSQPTTETLVPAPVEVNPYILAPWETETRAQRRIRTLSEKITTQKQTIKDLRKAIVDNKRLTKEQQNDALDMVRDNVPQDEQHKFFKGVLESTRPSAINRLIDRVSRHVEQRDHKLAVHGLKESFRKATNLRREFAEKVKEIKNSVDLKRFRGAEVAEGLRQWAAENPQAIFSDAEKSVLSRLEQQNVHGMSADDIRALSDYVERLAYESAAKDRLIGETESASLRDTGDSISRSIADAPRKRMRADDPLLRTGEVLDIRDRAVGSLLFHEVAERPEATLLQLSPELNSELYDKIRAARSNYKLRRAATNQLISGAFNSVGLTHDDSLAASMAHRIGLPSTELENWRSKKRRIGGVRMTRGEAWQIALWSRDPAALQNMMEAGAELDTGKRKLPPVTPTMLKDIFDFIGPQGEAVVDVAFEHLNTYIIDGVNEANEKMTGRALTDKKNVVPMVKADNEYVKFLTAGRTSAGMQEALADSYSHLKRREGGISPLRIPAGMDGIDMLMSHADRMHRFAAYAVPARNAEMILNDEPVRESIKDKNGEQGYEQIVDAVRSEVAGYSSVDELTKGLSALNHTVAGALIGGRISIMMAQPLDTLVAAAYDDGGMADVLTGVTNELTNRGPTKVYQEMSRVLGAHSGEWNGRYQSGHYAGEVTNGIFKQRSYFRPATLVEHAADPLKKSELVMAAMPNYLAAKESARRQLGLAANDFDAYENDPAWVRMVVDTWERKMVRGSNASDGMELSSGLRYAKKNPLAGLVMNFYNTSGKVYSLFTMAQNKLDAGDVSGAARFAAAGAASTMLFAALQTALTQGEKEKKNKTYWQRWLARSVTNTVGLHPALGQVIGDQLIAPAMGMPAYGDNPVLLAETGIEAIKGASAVVSQMMRDANEQEEPEKRIKEWIDFGRSAGPLLGLPTPAMIDIGQRIRKGAVFTGLQPAEKKPKRKSLSGASL